MYYGFPKMILTEQGRYFESTLIAGLCQKAQVKKLRMTPHQPQVNGQCECFSSMLVSMIGTLPKQAKVDWHSLIIMLVHVYNCTYSTVTGFSLYYLLYGRHPILPIDIEFGVRQVDLAESASHKYVGNLQNGLKWAYKKA